MSGDHFRERRGRLLTKSFFLTISSIFSSRISVTTAVLFGGPALLFLLLALALGLPLLLEAALLFLLALLALLLGLPLLVSLPLLVGAALLVGLPLLIGAALLVLPVLFLPGLFAPRLFAPRLFAPVLVGAGLRFGIPALPFGLFAARVIAGSIDFLLPPEVFVVAFAHFFPDPVLLVLPANFLLPFFPFRAVVAALRERDRS